MIVNGNQRQTRHTQRGSCPGSDPAGLVSAGTSLEQRIKRLILYSSAILAFIPVESSSAMPDPDEFDQQLRDLTSGQAEPAKFTVLSAAERLRRVPSPPPPPKRMNWRHARKARQLRRPVGEPGRGRPGKTSPRTRPRPKPAGGRKPRFIGIAKVVGIVVAFAALLYGLHLLGFGPH